MTYLRACASTAPTTSRSSGCSATRTTCSCSGQRRLPGALGRQAANASSTASSSAARTCAASRSPAPARATSRPGDRLGGRYDLDPDHGVPLPAAAAGRNSACVGRAFVDVGSLPNTSVTGSRASMRRRRLAARRRRRRRLLAQPVRPDQHRRRPGPGEEVLRPDAGLPLRLRHPLLNLRRDYA